MTKNNQLGGSTMLCRFITYTAILFLLILFLPFSVVMAEEAVVFADPNLEAAIRLAVERQIGDIYKSDLIGIKSLIIDDRDISDLTGLEHCVALTTLSLQENSISDISPISSLTQLTQLLLGVNRISDISTLSSLTDLEGLYIPANQIEEISPLRSLTELTKLNLWGNNIVDISPISEHKKLRELRLEMNNIVDISPLSNLPQLRRLYLHENKINNIQPLSNISGLTELTLSTNRIRDVSVLSSLTNLTRLFLSANQISDITAISRLTNLIELDLKENQVKDISPLLQNVGLGKGVWVALTPNPLSAESMNVFIPQLQARGVDVDWTPPPETVSTPSKPKGASGGDIGQTLDFSVESTYSNWGHSLEYSYDWSDDTYSGWLSATNASHSWNAPGVYHIRVRARCATHTNVVSAWSDERTITIGTLPPSFFISDLAIQPKEVNPRDTVLVSVLVSNEGGSIGNYDLVMEINGVQKEARSIRLAASDSRNVIFSVTTKQAGTYSVNVNGLSDTFRVTSSTTPMVARYPAIDLVTMMIIVLLVAGSLVSYFWWRRRRVIQLKQMSDGAGLWQQRIHNGITQAERKGATMEELGHEEFEWDVFISYATEDKVPFVRELANELKKRDVRVWFDEFTLRWGDKLYRSIEKGLAKSRFGIVILSPSFFAKEWPQKELDGLAVRERYGDKVILPIWLDIDVNDIASHSPSLANLKAVKASEGISEIVNQLLQLLHHSSLS